MAEVLTGMRGRDRKPEPILLCSDPWGAGGSPAVSEGTPLEPQALEKWGPAAEGNCEGQASVAAEPTPTANKAAPQPLPEQQSETGSVLTRELALF